MGLTLVLDYNEERQINVNAKNRDGGSVSIYFDTISMNSKLIWYWWSAILLDPVGLFSEGQYNLNNIKEIFVTDSFLGLNEKTRNCQNIETYNDCKTRLYVENLRKECGCLPLTLESSQKVPMNIYKNKKNKNEAMNLSVITN